MFSLYILLVCLLFGKVKKPPDDVLHERHVQTVNDTLPLPFIQDETGTFEYAQMMADGRLGHIEILGDLTGGHILIGK